MKKNLITTLIVISAILLAFIGNTAIALLAHNDYDLDLDLDLDDETPAFSASNYDLQGFILPDSVLNNRALMQFSFDGTLRITDPDILEEFIQINNIVPPTPTARLIEISFEPFNNAVVLPFDARLVDSFNLMPGWWYEIRNVVSRPPMQAIFTSSIRFDSFHNGTHIPTAYRNTFTMTASSTFTASVGLSANVVTAGVGFSVTESVTESTEISMTVPGHTTLIVETAIWAHVVDFDIFARDPNFPNFFSLVGRGDAARPNGVMRRTWLN